MANIKKIENKNGIQMELNNLCKNESIHTISHTKGNCRIYDG